MRKRQAFVIITQMRSGFSIILIITILVSGLYIYRQVEAVCLMPLTYRIGHLDTRFDLSFDEARVAIADAESVWEQATGENLFTYDPEGELAINFVFDERQEFAEAEEDFRGKLDEAKDTNDEIGETYESLVARYEILEVEYQARVDSYESKLSAYNTKVQDYNRTGGAPPDVFEELQLEQQTLDSEQRKINTLGRELNDLARQINRLGERGNKLIDVYNRDVNRYNETFGESREFTQGDYQGDKINIYKFTDTTELTLVLAHELGHALSLGHTENEASIMHHLMGGQPTDITVSLEDVSEFERVCGRTTRSWIERLFILFNI